jgi:hypothetical protein
LNKHNKQQTKTKQQEYKMNNLIDCNQFDKNRFFSSVLQYMQELDQEEKVENQPIVDAEAQMFPDQKDDSNDNCINANNKNQEIVDPQPPKSPKDLMYLASTKVRDIDEISFSWLAHLILLIKDAPFLICKESSKKDKVNDHFFLLWKDTVQIGSGYIQLALTIIGSLSEIVQPNSSPYFLMKIEKIDVTVEEWIEDAKQCMEDEKCKKLESSQHCDSNANDLQLEEVFGELPDFDNLDPYPDPEDNSFRNPLADLYPPVYEEISNPQQNKNISFHQEVEVN